MTGIFHEIAYCGFLERVPFRCRFSILFGEFCNTSHFNVLTFIEKFEKQDPIPKTEDRRGHVARNPLYFTCCFGLTRCTSRVRFFCFHTSSIFLFRPIESPSRYHHEGSHCYHSALPRPHCRPDRQRPHLGLLPKN